MQPTMFNFRRSEKNDDDERGINQMVQFLNKAYFLPLSSLSTSSKIDGTIYIIVARPYYKWYTYIVYCEIECGFRSEANFAEDVLQ